MSNTKRGINKSPKSGKARKKGSSKAKTKKTPGFISKLILGERNEGETFSVGAMLRSIVGVLCIAAFVLCFLLLLSFVFYSKEVYSVVHSSNPNISEDITLGTSGALLGYRLFNSYFGWASFPFVTLLFFVGSGLLWIERAYAWKVLRRIIQVIALTVSTSLLFACLQGVFGSEDSSLLWGGGLGVLYRDTLQRHLGTPGLIVVLLVALLITAMFLSPKVLSLVNQRPKKPEFNWSLWSLPSWLRKKSNTEDELIDNGSDEEWDEEDGDEEEENDVPEENDTTEAEPPSTPTIHTPAVPSSNPAVVDKGGELIVEVANPDDLVDVVEHHPYTPGFLLRSYRKPGIDLLLDYGSTNVAVNKEEIDATKQRILDTLASFKIQVIPHKATVGPTVTLYEVIPDQGVKVARISSLVDDLALNLKSEGIRIIAPMPGQGTVGIEVPNSRPQTVSMRSIMASRRYNEALERMELPVGIGKTITNEPFIFDLAKMPHLLIAGATGQGKSVGLNAMITSLLYSKRPEELKFIMVDPKMLEFSLYEELENHFMATLPDSEKAIITDMGKVVPTLNSLCVEMDNRYELLTRARVRNIKEYNEQVREGKLSRLDGFEFLPYIVLIVDEFADLIMTRGKEVEQPIARLAQKARAAGIHMVIATQRPSTDVITGLIKANFPARIAFKVFSMVDSRTILDSPGANQLIGRGDMLFYQGKEMIRVQCAFMDTPETEAIVKHIGIQESEGHPYELPEYIPENDGSAEPKDFNPKRKDALFEEAARLVVTAQVGSASVIQRKLEVGFARAGRIVDQLEGAGILGPQKGSKPRDILVQDLSALEDLLASLR